MSKDWLKSSTSFQLLTLTKQDPPTLSKFFNYSSSQTKLAYFGNKNYQDLTAKQNRKAFMNVMLHIRKDKCFMFCLTRQIQAYQELFYLIKLFHI